MTIRSQYIITLVVFTIMLTVIGVCLAMTDRKVAQLQRDSRLSHELELEIREFGYLFNDYLLHGDEEQRRRWQLKFASFSGNLDRFSSDDPVVARLGREMTVGRTFLASIFLQASQALEGSPVGTDGNDYLDLIRLSWSRMEIQNQALAHNASRISRHLDAQASRLQNWVTMLLFALVGLFGVFLLAHYATFNRRILMALKELQEGAAIIGAGNLHHEIEVKKNDEIGALTRAFNTMGDDLLEVIISKEELEREIRQRQLAEESLRQSEARYRTLFENITEEVHYWQIVRDETGGIRTWRLVDANPPTLATWKAASIEEIRGKTADELFGSGATEHYLPVVEKIMAEGTPHSFEDYFPHLGRYFRFTSVPLEEHFITTGADITKIKEAAEALRESNQELEQFASAASHDLREPLRVISNYLTLLEQSQAANLDDKGRTFLTKTMQTASRMEEMIRQLLDLSRINSSGGEFAPADIGEVLSHALEDLQTLVHESNAEIIAPDLPDAVVDSGQIRRLFQNLIANGIKYCDQERPVIRIEWSTDNGFYTFTVRDNGIGIAPEHHQDIFQIFRRLHSSGQYRGSGIGLAVCKKIVQRHGGRIWLESTIGAGAAFHFTLPRIRQEPSNSERYPEISDL